MANPQFSDEQPLSLVDVKKILEKVEKRDTELNYRSNKAKEYVDNFADILTPKQREEMKDKLNNLELTRLKYEHIMKIIDFLPTTLDDLRVVLQAFPLSLPKKDQEAIIGVAAQFA